MVSRLCLLTFFMVIHVAIGGRLLSQQDVHEGETILRKLETRKGGKNSHQEFFNGLSEEEKQWMLRLAITHEGEQLTGGSKPIPVNPDPPRIPDGVMDMMLNGDISNKFQARLIDWLKTDLGYTETDFKQFQTESSEFCSEGDTGCMSLRNLGGICCPFG